MALVLDPSEAARHASTPKIVRIALLGLGTIGAAVARLARERAAELRAHGVDPVVVSALVRSTSCSRDAAQFVRSVTADADRLFAGEPDVVVEAMGGVDAPYALVGRALELGIAVVSANKSLMAIHGAELLALARERGTSLRYEASCIAGVPFLGTFERRPLASRVRGVTAILNGTSNAIATALENGVHFDDALAHAQARGLAEPDPSADVSGADAAQKLAILVRLFGQLQVDPAALSATPLDVLDPADFDIAGAWDARIKPVAQARWIDGGVHAFVAPALVPSSHPLAEVRDAMNGIVLDTVHGPLCYTGPGAGPAVTAATLLDDVVEVVRERGTRPAAQTGVRTAASIDHPTTGWLLRANGLTCATASETLAACGIVHERLTWRDGRVYALTSSAPAERIDAVRKALRGRTGRDVFAIPSLAGCEESC